VGAADADVVELAVDAEGEFAVGVDAVGADPVVGVAGPLARAGFGPGVVGGGRVAWSGGTRGRPTDRSQASTGAAAEYEVRPPPGERALASSRAKVGVDLAGGRNASADDLLLGQALSVCTLWLRC
jgi:hypothetical protein